jgi:hydrogenase maturation protease
MNGTVAVIGVGNEFRSDDGLGLYAARELRRRGAGGIVVTEQSGEGTALLDTWQGQDVVVLIDAITSGGTPGEVHRIDCIASGVAHSLFRSSSHTFGVAEAIALGRSLGALPRVLLLYGIEGCRFDQGRGVSDQVLRGMPLLLAGVEDELARFTHHQEPAGEHP